MIILHLNIYFLRLTKIRIMKKSVIFLSTLLLGVFLVFVSGCDTTPEEECVQEEMCSGKTVTACCDESNCYFEYNGKIYGDDAESTEELLEDLGCTNTTMATYESDKRDLVLRLQALRDGVRTIN
jgi:hypothetical protein